MIIGLFNQKGGVGKTTVAVNIAAGLSLNNHRVFLLDADPQGSVLQWHAIQAHPAFDVDHIGDRDIQSALKKARQGYSHWIVDTPPALGAVSEQILSLAHLLIVPIGPSPLDVWSSKETIDRIAAHQKKRRHFSARLLICKKIPRTRIGRDAREALETYQLPIFSTEIGQRVAYVEAMLAGTSVLQFAPHSEAASEIRSLCSEILNL